MKHKLKWGDRVQVWDEKKVVCLGWGTVIELAYPINNRKKLTAFVMLDDKKKASKTDGCVWGDKYQFIPEKKAFEITRRIEKDLKNAK